MGLCRKEGAQVYRVAVCEDQPHMREELCGLCRQVLKELNVPYMLTPFVSAEELGEAMTRPV